MISLGFFLLAGMLLATAILALLHLVRRIDHDQETESGVSFSGLELELITVVRQHLLPQASEMIANQLLQLTRKFRFYLNDALTLELYEPQGIAVMAEHRFPRRDTFRLATLSFRIKTQLFRAEFTSFDGSLYRIRIVPSPKRFQRKTSVHLLRVHLNNPLLPLESATGANTGSHRAFSGFLGRWQAEDKIAETRAPATREQIRRFTDRRGAFPLPPDYLQIIEQTDGAIIGPYIIYALNETIDQAIDGVRYCFLAENSEGFIGVREKDNTAILYFYYFESKAVRIMGASLGKMIEAALSLDHPSLPED